MTESVKIVEVGPRDGLQNVKTEDGRDIILSVPVRVEFITRLAAADLEEIEATSFVSPKAVPCMAGASIVFNDVAYLQDHGLSLPVLTPNKRGYDAAIKAGARKVAFVTSPSNEFNRRNIGCDEEESYARLAEFSEDARERGVLIRGYVSCVAGSSYGDTVIADDVVRVSARLRDMGCYEISLGDTIGVGTPEQIDSLLSVLRRHVSMEDTAAHFHDTNGRAIDNLRVYLKHGGRVIDSAVSGLGGCNFAGPGAKGNVATQSVIRLCSEFGLVHNVDFGELDEAGEYILAEIKKARSQMPAPG